MITTRRAHPCRPPAVATIFLPFAAGYFLSYLFRTVNGPLSAQLVASFHLTPAELGVLTSLYFLTFGAFQIPAGLLIDRYGPRRVQIALLIVAASGAALCGLAQDVATLMLGRALIGLGSSASMVTGLKMLLLWLPPGRRALGNCALVMSGGCGAMASTTPLQAAAQVLDWQSIFLLLAAATVAVAVAVWRFVPEAGPAPAAGGAGDLGRGLRIVLRDARFWRIAPLSGAVVGAAFAIHGLWAARWLADVAHLAQPAIAAVLLAMGASLTAGAAIFGLLATTLRRRGVTATALFGYASIVFLAIEALLATGVAIPPVILLAAFAVFGAITVLSFTLIGELFPADLAGRANGALNVMHLGGAFAMQSGIGAIVALWPAGADGLVPEAAYAAAFATIMAIQGAALVWFTLSGAAARALLCRLAVTPASATIITP